MKNGYQEAFFDFKMESNLIQALSFLVAALQDSKEDGNTPLFSINDTKYIQIMIKLVSFIDLDQYG